MHRSAELLRRRRVGLIWTEVLVIRLVAVCAPVAFELSGVAVDDRDALVQVAVGEIRLVLFGVDEDLRDAAERHLIVAAAHVSRLAVFVQRPLARFGVADLEHELAALRELEHLRVAFAVAADPHVAFMVDRDAVIGRGPLVPLAGAAPMSHERALGVELEDRWRSGTALVGEMRLERFLLLSERPRAAMN